MKILSIHDLATIRKRAEHNLSLREESNEKVTEKCYGLASGAQHLQILICGGTGCKASSSQGITDNLLKAIQKNEITDKVEVITVGCFGFCEKGPIVKIIPDNTFYTQVTPEDAEEIINEHIIGGRRIERLLYVDPKTEHTVSDSKHMQREEKCWEQPACRLHSISEMPSVLMQADWLLMVATVIRLWRVYHLL